MENALGGLQGVERENGEKLCGLNYAGDVERLFISMEHMQHELDKPAVSLAPFSVIFTFGV